MTESNQKQLAYLQNIFKNLPHGAVNLSSKTSKILNQLKKHQDKELNLLSNLQKVASNEKFEIRLAIFHVQYQKLKNGAFTRQKFCEELNCMVLEEMVPQFNFWATLMWYMRNEKDEGEFLNLVEQFDFENEDRKDKNVGNNGTTSPESSEEPVPNKIKKLVRSSQKPSSETEQQNKINISSTSPRTGRKSQLRSSKNIKRTDNFQSSVNDANRNKENEKNSRIIDSSSESDENSKGDSLSVSSTIISKLINYHTRPKRRAYIRNQKIIYFQISGADR